MGQKGEFEFWYSDPNIDQCLVSPYAIWLHVQNEDTSHENKENDHQQWIV